MPEGQRTTLVTGASTGIGREIARIFASHGHDVVLVARSADKLEALADELSERHGVRARAVPLDLTDPEAPQELFDRVASWGVRVQVLVNDAAVMEFGPFREMPVESLAQLVSLNVHAFTLLTRLFVTPMVEAGYGRILNIASVASFLPLPSIAAYAASKAYILSLTEALSEELHGTGVQVTVCCPGFTATDMVKKIKGIDRLVGRVPLMEPEAVAKEAYEACMAGQVVGIPGLSNQLAIRLLGWYPRGVLRWFGGVIGRRVM